MLQNGRQGENKEFTLLQEHADARTSIDWREAFKRKYMGMLLRHLVAHVFDNLLPYDCE